MTAKDARQWFMFMATAPDRAGLAARIAAALHQGGWTLGEASMARLGGVFSIMLMARPAAGAGELPGLLAPLVEEFGLSWHAAPTPGGLHRQRVPEVYITAGGPERPGLLARVTAVLAEAGLDVLKLEAELAGTAKEPIFIVHLEGRAERGLAPLEAATLALRAEGLEVHLGPADAPEA